MFPRYLWGADWRKYTSPVLRTMTIIGYMQSGKTTFAKYLGYLMYKDLTSKGVDDSELAFIVTPSLKVANESITSILDIDKIRYLMLFVDDAIKSAHARKHNVEETKLFTDIRHWSMRKGILITMYATQDFKLLDRLMRSAMVYAWKTLPFEYFVSNDPNIRKLILQWIGDIDILELLEAITVAIYSNDPEKSLQALKTAIIRIPVQKYGPRPVRGIQPLTPPNSIYYEISEDTYEKEEDELDYDKEICEYALKSLERLLKKLYDEYGFRYKWNKEYYLLVESPNFYKKSTFSLGPLGKYEFYKKLIDKIRGFKVEEER